MSTENSTIPFGVIVAEGCTACDTLIMPGTYCKDCFANKVEKDSKVISLVDKLPIKYDVEHALDQAYLDLKTEPESHMAKANKVLIISLYDKDDTYSVDYISSGMQMSEMVALAELFKRKLLIDMSV